MKYFISVISIFLFFGCGTWFETPFLGASQVSSGAFLTSRLYIKPEYKGTKPLSGSTKDYGASFKEKEYKYEEIYYEKTKNGRDDIVISKKFFGQLNIVEKDLMNKMMKIFLFIKSKEINISDTIGKVDVSLR